MIELSPDRLTRPGMPEPGRKQGDEDGPTAPDIDRPAPSNPLRERLKKLDRDQAKKYRQRSGE